MWVMSDDDGYVHITGRIKDIVIRGGENIFPGDTEQACYQIDGMQECVVFGIPDDAMGEELAMIVRVADSTLTPETMRAALKTRIAGYKIPKFIEMTHGTAARGATEKFDKRKFSLIKRGDSAGYLPLASAHMSLTALCFNDTEPKTAIDRNKLPSGVGCVV